MTSYNYNLISFIAENYLLILSVAGLIIYWGYIIIFNKSPAETILLPAVTDDQFFTREFHYKESTLDIFMSEASKMMGFVFITSFITCYIIVDYYLLKDSLGFDEFGFYLYLVLSFGYMILISLWKKKEIVVSPQGVQVISRANKKVFFPWSRINDIVLTKTRNYSYKNRSVDYSYYLSIKTNQDGPINFISCDYHTLEPIFQWSKKYRPEIISEIKCYSLDWRLPDKEILASIAHGFHLKAYIKNYFISLTIVIVSFLLMAYFKTLWPFFLS